MTRRDHNTCKSLRMKPLSCSAVTVLNALTRSPFVLYIAFFEMRPLTDFCTKNFCDMGSWVFGRHRFWASFLAGKSRGIGCCPTHTTNRHLLTNHLLLILISIIRQQRARGRGPPPGNHRGNGRTRARRHSFSLLRVFKQRASEKILIAFPSSSGSMPYACFMRFVWVRGILSRRVLCCRERERRRRNLRA